ncbi:MAG: response regulator [Candidatus Sumerlaeota bacterium]|nr:response regulator [Candidatus Sumerlaeota bacterium]
MARILIVEDDANSLALVVQLLEETHQVLTAQDGCEAVRRAAEERPDLIVMDLALPGMSGWEAAECIRGDARTRTIPILALTAHVMEAQREAAFQAGCDALLSKPVEEDRLFQQIDTLLQRGRTAHGEDSDRR